MSILSRFREWRRSRALKYLNSNGTGLTVRPRHTWIPHWLRGDYTLKNSELIFAAVTRISNSLSVILSIHFLLSLFIAFAFNDETY